MTTLRGRHGARRFFPTNPLCASSLVCVHVSLLEVASRFSCVPSTTDCRPTLTKTLVSKRRARQHSHQLKIMKNHIFLVFRNLSRPSLLPIIPSPSHFSGRTYGPDFVRRRKTSPTSRDFDRKEKSKTFSIVDNTVDDVRSCGMKSDFFSYFLL